MRGAHFGSLILGAATLTTAAFAVQDSASADAVSADAGPESSDPASDLASDPFEVPDGLEWSLWAETPHLYNPTAMDIDHRGRIWVTEGVNYRKWDGRNPGRDHPEGERVVILEDTDLDGVCDSSKVFVQDPDLVSPLGICILGNKVLVAASPNLFVYTDTDGDDVADKRETLLTGFGGYDHDHGLHSPVFGPDGKLYIAVGNAGPHIVTDKDGWTLRSGSLYNGGGPTIADNKPGLVSDDGRAYTGGLVLRMNVDGSGLEVLAHNFRNNYEVAVDAYGDMFLSDNDDDGNRGCRYVWVMEGGDYGYFSSDGTRYWRPDMRPGQSIETAHWHQDDPGVVPSPLITGAGGPTGVAMYEGHLMAPWFDGFMLGADAGAKTVYACEPKVRGAGIEMLNGFLIRSRVGHPDEHQFRPSDVAVAHDGSVFVADWYDPGVGGHRAQDEKAYGRILRIAPEEFRPAKKTWRWDTPGAQLTAFQSPAPAVRYLGHKLLTDGSSESTRLLGSMLTPGNPPRTRARALLAAASQGAESLRQGFASFSNTKISDHRMAATVARAVHLCGTLGSDEPLGNPITEMEVLPTLLREILASSTYATVEDDRAQSLLQGTMRTYLSGHQDRFLLEALGQFMRGHELAGYKDTLLGLIGKDPLTWPANGATIAWRLHPKEAIPAFVARAMHAELDVDARRQMIDALAFIPDRAAAEAMSTIALGGPEDLRGYAQWWLRHRSTNDWRDYDIVDASSGVSIEGAELLWSSDLVKQGTVNVEVDITGADTLWLVVTDGDNGNGCDWADWLEPRVLTGKKTMDLTKVSWIEASAQWGSVNVGKNANGGPMMVDGVEYTDGIGTHAASTIAFKLPANARTFTAIAATDDGGTTQGATSVKFQVFASKPTTGSRIPQLTATMLDTNADAELRRTSARELAQDADGAHTILALAQLGRIDDVIAPAITEVIFDHPDANVRALATRHFANPAAVDATATSLDELTAMRGDPSKGRDLFLSERAQCSTCHGFTSGLATRGGDIGPDLTEIRKKYGKRELFEAIQNPSAAIAFGYDTYLIVDTDGLYHTGFLLADGADVVLKTTQGERIVLDADDIESRHKQKLSAMPEGVAMDLSSQELADLVAFLAHDPAASPTLGEPIALFDGSGMDAWTYHLTDGAASMDDVWSIDNDGVLICKGNPIGYIRTHDQYTNYVLELDWRFDPAKGGGNSGVLLRMTGEDKVWPRSMEAQLQSRSAGDIWNIEEFPARADASRTSGRRTERMAPCNEKPLGEWNHYRIEMNGGSLRLEVNGQLQNWADWCEEIPGHVCLQSEGAEIHFRNITLTPIL